VTPESNNTQNEFEFKKRVPVTTVPLVETSFLLITYPFLLLQALEVGAVGKEGSRVLPHRYSQPLVLELRHNEVFWAYTPHALVSTHLAFRGGVVSSSTFPMGLYCMCRTTLGRSESRLLLIYTLAQGSPLDPFALLIYWVQKDPSNYIQ